MQLFEATQLSFEQLRLMPLGQITVRWQAARAVIENIITNEKATHATVIDNTSNLTLMVFMGDTSVRKQLWIVTFRLVQIQRSGFAKLIHLN
jgi:hypothetical protein